MVKLFIQATCSFPPFLWCLRVCFPAPSGLGLRLSLRFRDSRGSRGAIHHPDQLLQAGPWSSTRRNIASIGTAVQQSAQSFATSCHTSFAWDFHFGLGLVFIGSPSCCPEAHWFRIVWAVRVDLPPSTNQAVNLGPERLFMKNANRFPKKILKLLKLVFLIFNKNKIVLWHQPFIFNSDQIKPGFWLKPFSFIWLIVKSSFPRVSEASLDFEMTREVSITLMFSPDASHCFNRSFRSWITQVCLPFVWPSGWK